MRIKRSLILVAFLLVLYIGPMLFMSSYGHTGIVAEPNTVKEFSLASEWYDESWTYRKSIKIQPNYGTPAGIDYQVQIPITYDSDMQTDFADIRFTDNDGITLLDYWLESYIASTSAVFWVEIADELNVPVIIYMYYGNSEVSTTSNGTATFLFYEDWSTQSVRAEVWDIVASDGTITYDATDANHGYVMRAVGNGDSLIYHIESDLDTLAPISILFRSYIELTDAANHQRLRQGTGAFADTSAYVASNQGIQQFVVTDDDSNDDTQVILDTYFDSYHTFMITRDGTTATLYSDYALVDTGSCDPDIISNPIAFVYARDTEHELYSDWIAGRKFVTNEPSVDSFGDEETEETYPRWREVGEANLLFSVPFDMWGFDTALIILGLVMIPVSTIYLAYGVKNDRSSDRLFYGLIIFFLGFGLLIGGIMP